MYLVEACNEHLRAGSKIIKGLLPLVATPFILVIYKKVKRIETSQPQVVLIKRTNYCIFKANENYVLKY